MGFLPGGLVHFVDSLAAECSGPLPGPGLPLLPHYHPPVAAHQFLAFVSYAHRYAEWVAVLQRNLERCLAHHGRTEKVFLDQVDLGTGRSWVAQLQAGVARANHLVLVATPEALASPRVEDEWEGFIATRRDWARGHFHVVSLVPAPLPPFLERMQRVDFSAHDPAKYHRSLAELLAGLLGREDRRELPELADALELPDPPNPGLPTPLRRELVAWLAPLLGGPFSRRAVAAALGLDRKALDGHASPACAASAALVAYTGDDDPVTAALRLIDVLAGELTEEDPDRVAALGPLRRRLAELGPGAGLLGVYLQRVVRDHERLVPYFQQRAELEILDRVYVRLELVPERLRAEAGARPDGPEELLRLDRPRSLRELLELERLEHTWVTGRWVALGDPGAGKTTLLRHLAASLAREGRAGRRRWTPVYAPLPRLVREREWLFDRLARQLERVGHPARGLPAVLEREAEEGRLLLLLDGLDEVPGEERDEAEGLLRDLAARWPRTPLVVASRPIGFRSPGSAFRELEILPLDSGRRREFLARWFGRATGEPDEARAGTALAALEEDPGLRELAGNPLYLTLMALLLEQGDAPARNRTRLYDQVFELLLEGRHRPQPEPMEHQEAVRAALRHLAYGLTEEDRDAAPLTAIEARLYQPEADALREPLERVPRWRRSLRPFLDDVARRTGILGPHDGEDADWRFWHRTFREALASEELATRWGAGGEAAILDHARQVEGDESRWAEPYALLAGRVEAPDDLVRALVREAPPLGLRALATAQGLREDTLREILELTGDWEKRADVYRRLPELLGDGERALLLIDRLRRATRDGNDLYFLDRAVAEVARRWPEARRRAQGLRRRFYDHIPGPPEELFRTVETPLDGPVPLWCEAPAGSYAIGSPEGEGQDREHPRHEVHLVSPFRIGAVPVTNAQYAAFDPKYQWEPWEGVAAEELPHHPVVNVTWYAAVSFCRWLACLGGDLAGARLPTEEEWEVACRAGSPHRYWAGDAEEDLTRMGWYDANAEDRTHRVGEKPPNPWGLYDVHGNVWEWTLTPWDAERYQGREEAGYRLDPTTVDPDADLPADPAGGGRRVMRGGSVWIGAGRARAACRSIGDPGHVIVDRGFRVLLPATPSDRS